MSNILTNTTRLQNVLEALQTKATPPAVDPSQIIPKTKNGYEYIYLDDISEHEHEMQIQLSSDTITDFSNTEVHVCGRNLIPFPYNGQYGVGDSTTKSGVTFTIGENREIICNGTATATATFYCIYYTKRKLPYDTYAFSGCPMGGSSSTYYLNFAFYTDNFASYVIGNTDKGAGMTVKNAGTKATACMMAVTIVKGYQCNNLVFKPMLQIGVFNHPYEDYYGETYMASVNGLCQIDSLPKYLNVIAMNSSISVDYQKSYGVQRAEDQFWEDYQRGGTQTVYLYAFAGQGWRDSVFKPKYDIVPTGGGATRMFSRSYITDLKGLLEQAGVKLDLSKVTAISYFMDDYAQVTRLPILDTTSISSMAYFIYNCNLLEYIEKIIFKADGSQAVANTTIGNCPALKEIRFEGVIGQNGLNMKSSVILSKESIISLINVLSATTSGLTVTLSRAAVNAAFETSAGANDGSASIEWADLIATRTNWTITLA